MRDDLVFDIDDARGAVGGVALGADALIPVVVGRGGILGLHGFQPGIFAGRLIEVAVNADEALGGGHDFPDAGRARGRVRGHPFIVGWRRAWGGAAGRARSQARHRYQLATNETASTVPALEYDVRLGQILRRYGRDLGRRMNVSA